MNENECEKIDENDNEDMTFKEWGLVESNTSIRTLYTLNIMRKADRFRVKSKMNGNYNGCKTS